VLSDCSFRMAFLNLVNMSRLRSNWSSRFQSLTADGISETGWTTLSSRRNNRKLQLFCNIKNGHAPNYLRELIPPTVQNTTIYPLRNGSDLIIPFCRLSITTESFIPSNTSYFSIIRTGKKIMECIFPWSSTGTSSIIYYINLW
jgi:hypothetical protein